MEHGLDLRGMAGSVVYAVVGGLVLVLAFAVFDRLTPYSLWREIIQRRNTALAIVVGSIAIGLSLIIAAAIQG